MSGLSSSCSARAGRGSVGGACSSSSAAGSGSGSGGAAGLVRRLRGFSGMTAVASSAGTVSAARAKASSAWYSPGGTSAAAAFARRRRGLGGRAAATSSSASFPAGAASDAARPVSAPSLRGMAAIGVAVMMSTAKKNRMASTGIATHALSRTVSGVPMSQPTMPPASWTPAKSCVGLGTPRATWMMPVTATTAIAIPIVTRPLSLPRSGWRMSRTARTARTTGSSTASSPMLPAVTAWMTVPAAPERPNHSRAATTTASASSSRATPSFRSAGSSPRAPLPIRRSVPPMTWAIPSHSPRTIRIGHGGRDGLGARLDRPPVRAVERVLGLPDRADRAGEVVRVAMGSSKRCVADAPAGPLNHTDPRVRRVDTRAWPDSSGSPGQRTGSAAGDSDAQQQAGPQREEAGEQEGRAEVEQHDEAVGPLPSGTEGGEEEAGGHEDRRDEHAGAGEPGPPAAQRGGLREEQAHQPEHDEDPRVGVAGAEERRLERRRRDASADHAGHEPAAGGDGGRREDGDPGRDLGGRREFEHGDLLDSANTVS